ncbi:dNA internalization-related competence protein ComEC/Rec2 [Clostridium sp. CAG:524]|nr:dNA internalization-related competence protein ComEC/Rec2 [Clostridium sp. CAG:524]
MKHFSLKLRIILLCDYLYYILFFITCIFLLININKKIDVPILTNNSYELIINDYKINDKTITIYFDNIIGKYYVDNDEKVKEFKDNYSFGDKIYIEGEISVPNNNTIPNNFNYKDYLYHKYIYYIIKIDKIKMISKNDNIFLNIKNSIYKRIDKIKYNNYLYAFILGKSYYIDSEVLNNYKINGITHLFALSGLHVSMFSSIILFILKKIKLSEKLSYFITSLFLIFFAFIASFTPSIVRSVLFFILSSINNVYYLYIKPKYLLYIVFSILIFINPFYIYDTGFILSFCISFFILLFNEKNKINNNLLSILVISILSTLSSLPIIINMSYEINILGFINNLFFIPYVTYIVFPLSIIVVFISKLSFILNFLIIIMEYVSKVSSNIFNIKLIFPKMSLFLIIIYYVLLILIVKKINLKKIFIIYLSFLYFRCDFDKNNYVYFIDVGQGDSALIVTKNNKSVLIDTGGKVGSNYSLMKSNVIPFFKSIGIRKLDYLFITHGDYDHAGYGIDLVNNFNVKNRFTNKGKYNSLEKKLNIKSFNNSYIKIDNVEIYSLNSKLYNNENSDSLVLLVIIDNYKLLFMGDASINTEKDIMNNYDIGDVFILKVGHHGSKTSSSEEFINSVNPKYSIISVGKNNKFGHPNKEVLDNLSNSKIYRTDIDGSIMFKIKKDKLRIETYSP